MATSTIFRTERLAVRPWSRADADAVLAIYGDPEVARWTSTPEPMVDLSEAEERIQGWLDSMDPSRGFGVWAVTEVGQDRPIGTVVVRALADSDEVEIGWALHPSFQGRGYATEAARGALEHARAHGHRRARAIMWPDNEPSKAVCRRIGMTELGEIPDPWYGTAEEPNSLMFVIDLV